MLLVLQAQIKGCGKSRVHILQGLDTLKHIFLSVPDGKKRTDLVSILDQIAP